MKVSLERYARQIVYSKIGVGGQERLAAGRAAVIGLGALGSVIAQELCRAGVGFLRIVDRDHVELVNLHRQTLYDEEDARRGLAKAEAAAVRLRAMNSAVEIEPVTVEVLAANVEALVRDVDVVVDGSDNFRLRFLVNDACVKHGIPWVYGGAVMDQGATMTIIPGRTACLRCILRELPPQSASPVAATAGVLNMTTGVVGSLEAMEALKILLGGEGVRSSYLSLSLWDAGFVEAPVERDPECPVCGRRVFAALESG